MNLITIYSLLTTAVIAGLIVMVLAPQKYRILGILFSLMSVFVMGYVIFEMILIIVMAIIYILFIHTVIGKSDVQFYISYLRIGLPIAIFAGIFVGGAVYFILDSQAILLQNIETNKELNISNLGIDLVFIVITLFSIATIGIWGVTMRMPSYLKLLNKFDINEENDGEKND